MKKAFDIMGEEILELSTENESLNGKAPVVRKN